MASADPSASTARGKVSSVTVDEDGIRVVAKREIVVDVLFDDRRVWSYWLIRDGVAVRDGFFKAWPKSLRRFLDGVTRLKLTEHANQRVLFDEDIQFGERSERIAVVNDNGLPLGIDNSGRLAQTFDTRTAEHVAPLLDSIEEVLRALGSCGIEAFPAYGTLLGAVRGGKLIGHDSDADLGYVSRHENPVDVTRESFRLQRHLSEMGYTTARYSGAAFRVDVREADGSFRGLDVFGGFLNNGYLSLMGEVRAPFKREWIFPLGTCMFEGRELPAPAEPDRMVAAMYGERWRVPDPAFRFTTPDSTSRRLNGWFRGTRVRRPDWDRAYSGVAKKLPDSLEPSKFARWVVEEETAAGDLPGHLLDVGCGRGQDGYWYARQGVPVTGLDFALRGSAALAALAKKDGVPFERRFLNLCELRSTLSIGALMARSPGPRVVTARHIADATDAFSRGNLWKLSQMMLRDGGRLYLEFLVRRAPRGDPFARKNHLRSLPVDLVVSELEARDATVVHREVHKTTTGPGAAGQRIGRLVVEWQR